MPYDDDAIRKGREKGIFNDGFDPLALGISEEEKKRMAKGFADAKKDLALPVPPTDIARPALNRNRKGKVEYGKSNIFERIVRFVIMLFTGTSRADYEKKRLLRELKRAIKKIKPAIYNFSTDTVTGEFAKQVHVLLQLIWPYRRAFEDIFGESDQERHLQFQLFYVCSMTPFADAAACERFSMESILELVRNEKDLVVRKRIDEITDLFLNRFDDDVRRQLDRSFAEVINIKDMINFNFFGLLKKFDAAYKLESSSPDFHDIRPQGLGEMLKDLETVILAVNAKLLPSIMDMAAGYYRESIAPFQEPDEAEANMTHMQNLSASGYRQLTGAMLKIVSAQQLCLLIRYVTKNVEYEPHLYPRGTNFFDEFSRDLVVVLEERVTRALARRKEEEIEAKMRELFETEEQLPDYLYADASNALLEKLELPAFLYTKLFNLGMRFFSEKYYQYIKRTLNKLIVDGSFKDSLARRMLADEFYRIDDLYSKLLAFSNTVNTRKEKGGMLQGMLQKFKGDLASKKALTSRIGVINQEVHGVLHEMRDCLQNLQIVLVRIDRDCETDKPEVVDNLHKIGLTANTRFLGELKRSTREMVIFSEIITKVFKD